MGRKDLGVVRKRQELLVNALVQDRGKLLWGMGRGEVGPSHIAN
jgi:hypothetical protein